MAYENLFKLSPNITTLPNYHCNESAKFLLYEKCVISDCIRRGWRWEEHQHDVIDKYLNSDSIVVEVGAHIGTITIKLSKVAKEVHSFEPLKPSYDVLNTNLSLNNCTNVITYQQGVSDKISSTYIKWVTENNVGASGLEGGTMTQDISLLDKKIKVDLVSIDSLNLNKVDYIKIDVEGYEELVVKGAKNTIEENHPLMIIESFEKLNSNDVRASDESLHKRFGFLFDLGYIYEELYEWDFLFIPKHLQIHE
jgi:FkbM family methyltransferase